PSRLASTVAPSRSWRARPQPRLPFCACVRFARSRFRSCSSPARLWREPSSRAACRIRAASPFISFRSRPPSLYARRQPCCRAPSLVGNTIMRSLCNGIAVTAGVAVLAACGPPPASPGLPASSVDVLSYLLGDASLWPRVGSHAQNQIVDLSRREVCWTKYANPRRFECWRGDEEYVYHAVGHALDGHSNETYHFTDGRWLPRYLPAGPTAASPWSLDVSRNEIVWFDASCLINPSRSHLFPYRMRAWIEPRVDAGPDLGPRDALLLDYQPYDPAAP